MGCCCLLAVDVDIGVQLEGATSDVHLIGLYSAALMWCRWYSLNCNGTLYVEERRERRRRRNRL